MTVRSKFHLQKNPAPIGSAEIESAMQRTIENHNAGVSGDILCAAPRADRQALKNGATMPEGNHRTF